MASTSPRQWTKLLAASLALGTPWAFAQGSAAPDPVQATVQVGLVSQEQRLEHVLSILATQPDQTEAMRQLDELLEEMLSTADELGDLGELDQMDRQLALIRSANPAKSGLMETYRRLEMLRAVSHHFEQAREALRLGWLVEPAKRSAAFHFHETLKVDPGNAQAQAGLYSIQHSLLGRARQSAEDLDFESATEWLAQAEQLELPGNEVAAARDEIASQRDVQAGQIERDISEFLLKGEFARAEFALIDLIALGGNGDRVRAMRDQIEAARHYGGLAPGAVLSSELTPLGDLAPALVVLPAGSFLMGSPETERGRTENEEPLHRVTLVKGFALGLHEVTVAQFGAFVSATGYRTAAERDGHSLVYDEHLGRITERPGVNWRHDYAGRHSDQSLPVLHVSWHDAHAYAEWLAGATGQAYRLPSEAEFEYALRAGSATVYWWGDSSPETGVENLTGSADESPGGRSWSVAFQGYSDGHWGPAPVASYSANPFGLHDMGGNASEWVADCWHANFVRAPLDGSAWINPGCERRVVRGGYWASSPAQARSAYRLYADAGLHGARVGFRVARDL